MALQSFTGSLTQPNTTTGNQAYTGVGFVPKVIIFFANALTADGSSANSIITVGMAVSASNRATITNTANNNVAANTAIQRRMDNSKCLTFIDGTGTVLTAADLVSFDSDGFTLNWTTADSTQRIINYLALGGGDLSNVNMIQNNAASVTGNQAYTGMGFKPDAIILMSTLQSAAAPATNTQTELMLGFGTDSTHRGAIAGNSQAVSPTATDVSQQTSLAFVAVNGASIFAQADLVSLDSDGFTLNWTQAPGGTRPFWTIGLKGGKYSVGSFNQATGTGNQVTTSPGFMPSGLILASFNNTSSATQQVNNRMSFGLASGSNARAGLFYGDRNNVSTTITSSHLDRANILKMLAENGASVTTSAVADFVSFNPNGFTLNWTTVDATAREIIYFAFGSTPPMAFSNATFVIKFSGNLAFNSK